LRSILKWRYSLQICYKVKLYQIDYSQLVGGVQETLEFQAGITFDQPLLRQDIETIC